MKRRRFVAAAAATAAGALGCGGGGGSSPTGPAATPTPAASSSPEVRLPLMNVGETVAAQASLVSGLVTPIAVTRLSETEVTAVSRVCTHQACTVGLPATPGAVMECPCHGSQYRANGQLVRGPAPRALAAFPAVIRGAEVVVTVAV